MNLIKCIMTESTCYKGTTEGVPVGILFHDTGAGNPNVKRYVQPSKNDPNRAALLQTIGVNQYGNDWNSISVQKGVNAFIGNIANGSVATVQALPFNFRPWGCGSGSNGSCNGSPKIQNSPFWLQFEICDDGYKSADYFKQIYKEAVEFAAYLCKQFGIDPNGTVKYTDPVKKVPVTVPTILCHHDAYALGLGSNHADVLTWWKRYGKTMQQTRADVAALLKSDAQTDETLYRVQVGSFRNKGYAEAFLADVQKHYPNAFITTVKK